MTRVLLNRIPREHTTLSHHDPSERVLRPLKTTRKAGGAYRHYFAYTVTDDFHGAVLMEGQDWRVMTPAEIENADVLEPHLELLRWYWPQPRT